jgi:hypothetical protein
LHTWKLLKFSPAPFGVYIWPELQLTSIAMIYWFCKCYKLFRESTALIDVFSRILNFMAWVFLILT